MSAEGENRFASRGTSKLYLNSDLSDVTFEFRSEDDVEQVPAVKSILAASSSVFSAMFFGPMKEGDTVEIVDCSADAFKEFLKFFYLDSVQLTMENMEQVLALTDKYDVHDCLTAYVTSFVFKLTLDKICWGYQLAIVSNNEALEKYCEEFICQYPDEIFKSSTFLHCNQNVLERILQLDELLCEESDVFAACIKWAKFVAEQKGLDESDARTLRIQLGDCFGLIRFNAMPPEEFVAHTVQYEKMFTRDELVHILYESAPAFKTTNKFDSCPRYSPEWDSKTVLSCERDSAATPSSAYYIQNSESIWFSTNRTLLLGQFDCCSLQHPTYAVNLHFDITIKELDKVKVETVDEAAVNQSTKIVFKGTANINNASIKVHLQRPIIVRPTKIYQICLEASANSSGYFSTCAEWPAEVKLNATTNVSFHQDRSKTECRGLVSCLSFNNCESN